MEYKKLFDIEYNNKTFTLFLGKDKRIAFLEKGEQDKYFYPAFEDFKVLNNIYNVRNPFIFYSSKKAFFKEKVLLASGILAVVMSIYPLFGLNAEYKIDEEEGIVYVTLADNTFRSKTFKDTSDLDEVLGYTSVTKEEIMDAINNNPNLSEYYKILARNLVNKYLEVVPNADLRIFYENIKTLKIVEVPDDSVQEVLGTFVAGNYNSYDNQINLKENATLEIIYHELAHITESYCGDLGDDLKIYRYLENHGLNEAMNNKIVELLTNSYSYSDEELVLNYLLSFVDYTLEDYNKYGIDELINRLKTKYSNIDFDYITSFVDSFSTPLTSFGPNISLASNLDFLDELFNLALASINLDGNVYEPYTNFIKLIYDEELENSYLEKYNNYLKSLNYEDIVTIDELNEIANKYKDCEDVVYYQNELYLANVYRDEELNSYVDIVIGDELKAVNPLDVDANKVIGIKASEMIKSNYLKYKDIYGTQEFWNNMITENDLIEDYKYKKIPIYLDGYLITEDYIKNQEVVISQDENGNILYNLVNKDDPSIENYLYKGNLNLYTFLYNFDDKLELSYIFNDTYFKKLNQIYPSLFRNILSTDDEIKLLNDYVLHIPEENSYYPLDECNIVSDNGKISIPELGIEIDKELPTNVSFNLTEVIKHSRPFSNNIFKYSYSKEEIIDMVSEYVDRLIEKTNLSR